MMLHMQDVSIGVIKEVYVLHLMKRVHVIVQLDMAMKIVV